MSVLDLPVIAMLRAKMTFLNERQTVISENVANSNTVGYVARDVSSKDFDDIMRSVDSGSASGVRKMRISVEDRPDPHSSITGNAVSLENQMMKSAENQMQFQAAVDIYKKSVNLIRIAVRNSGGS